MTVRFAAADDAPAIRDVYAPVVRETAVSFAETPPSARPTPTRRSRSRGPSGSRPRSNAARRASRSETKSTP